MKRCNTCGMDWQARWATAEDAFARDQSRPDGLALQCRHCNALKCRAWYERKRDQKMQYALEYRRLHGYSPNRGRRRERILDPAGLQPIAQAPASDVRIIALRVAAEEWAWLDAESSARGLTVDDLVRLCINQARVAIARESADESEETHAETETIPLQ